MNEFPTVWVLYYQHEYGVDGGVYATKELAVKDLLGIMRGYLWRFREALESNKIYSFDRKEYSAFQMLYKFVKASQYKNDYIVASAIYTAVTGHDLYIAEKSLDGAKQIVLA